jgi:DNA-binding transcriptional LysR family regulator
MNLSHIHISDIQVFLAVAQSGSLVTASRKLGTNHSTAFRWLKRFEEQIGHKLFDRSNNHYVLSETGHIILPIAETIASEITSLSMLADSLDSHLVGEVKVTSADALVLGYFPQIIQRFYQQYPGITINLSSQNHFANLSKREADIAIRPTHTLTGNMIGRKAASMVFGLYASPEYIDKYGMPNVDNRGKGHLLCDYDTTLSHLYAAQWVTENMSNADVVIKLTSTVSLAEFAKAGMGVAALPCFLADTDKNLVKVIGFDSGVASDIWVLTHPDLRHSPKIRAVLDFMFDEIRRDEKYFLGQKC